MGLLEKTVREITPADERAAQAARRRWDSIAKPLHSLGLLEDAVVRIAAMGGSPDVDLSRRAIVGHVRRPRRGGRGGDSRQDRRSPPSSQRICPRGYQRLLHGRVADAELVPVDIGVARPVEGARILQRNLMRGPAI